MSSFGYKGKYNLKSESVLNSVAFEWGMVLMLALALFGLTAAIMPITYTFIASDDRFLASYLAGYWSGVPESSLPFINPIFCKFVSPLVSGSARRHTFSVLCFDRTECFLCFQKQRYPLGISVGYQCGDLL